MNNSPGLSSVRMTRMTRSIKERRKRTTNKEISLNNPQRGEGTKARRGIPRRRELHHKRGEETSSPPQKSSAARLPLYFAVGWGKV
jgi:hypothetical protein